MDVKPRSVLALSRFLFTACAAASCASAPPPRPASWHRGDLSYASAYLDWMIRREMSQHHVRGLSVVVVSDARTLFSRGYGYADPARGVAATADTVYRVGSVSKVMTAALVMSLVEQGVADLDAPVTSYEPAFTIRTRFPEAPITLRQILSHHAGLPSNVVRGMWVDAPAPLSDVTRLLSEESLVSPPGTMFNYSNIGYGLAGRVVEALAHVPFGEYARRTLFAPLAMSSTSFDRPPELMARLAVGFAGEHVVAPTPLRDVPAGAALSTAADMGRFVQAMLSRGALGDARVLRPESVATLFTPQFVGRPLDFGHVVALDWVTDGLGVRDAGETVAWHNGYAPPFQAHVSVLREARLGVVVLSNSAEAPVTRIGVRALELMRESQTGVALPEPSEPDPAVAEVPRSDLDRVAGEYLGLGGQVMQISRDGDRLQTSLFGRPMQLIPTGHDVFVPRATAVFGIFGRTLANLRVSFEEAAGRHVAVLRGDGGTFVLFERVPRPPIPEAWRRRAGAYRTDATGETFSLDAIALAADGGVLTLSLTLRARDEGGAGTRVLRLLPLSDDEAIVAGIGDANNSSGATLRAVRDARGETLRYSGFVLRR